MPQLRAAKEQVIQELTTSLAEAESVYITDLTGLNVEKVTILRRQLRAESAECKVVKNTLTRFAMQNAGLPDLGAYLEGPTALIISKDPVAPAKVLVDFGKQNEDRPRIKGGLLTGAVIAAGQVQELASLPSRDELIARAVRGIAAPITGLVFSLSGVLGNLVRVLAAVSAQKESGGSEGEPE